jgi:predicted nucleic acid-binding Zn ribbon protein
VSMTRRTSLRPQLIFSLVMAVVVLGMVRIAQYHWREGTVIIGGALLLAAGLRAVLPPERTGLLGIRRRALDVLTYGVFGLMMLIVALTIIGGPLAAS